MFYLIPIIISLSFSQEIVTKDTIQIREEKEKLLYDFKKYETVDLGDFTSVLEDLGKRTTLYIKYRKSECLGDFSIIEMDQTGNTKAVKKKLNKAEKKLCMLDLVNFQRRFTNLIYKLRKKQLQLDHKKQFDLLEEHRRGNINELDKLASKYK